MTASRYRIRGHRWGSPPRSSSGYRVVEFKNVAFIDLDIRRDSLPEVLAIQQTYCPVLPKETV